MQKSKDIALYDLQQLIRAVVVDPKSDIASKSFVYKFLNQHNPLPHERGLNIYVDAYLSKFVESLSTDFPVTKKLIGEKPFYQLVSMYLKRYPSHFTNVTDVGRFLPTFVKKNKNAGKFKYLSELVDLEWECVEAFHADNLPPLNIDLFLNMSDNDWSSARFVFDPSCRLCHCHWPVHELLACVDSVDFSKIVKAFKKRSVHLILYRINSLVKFNEISSIEHKMLCLLKAGNTLDVLMEKMDDVSETLLTGFFQKWTQYGLIKDILI